jgi:hypothetical protein
MTRYCKITGTTLDQTASGLLLISTEEDIQIPVPPGVLFYPDLWTEESGFAAYIGPGWDYSYLHPVGQPTVSPPQDGNEWKPAGRINLTFETYGSWLLASNTSTGLSYIENFRRKVRRYPEMQQQGLNPLFSVGAAEAVSVTIPGTKHKRLIFKPAAKFLESWVVRHQELHGPCTVAIPGPEEADPIKILITSTRGQPLIVADEVFATARKSSRAPLPPRTIPPPKPIDDDEIRF